MIATDCSTATTATRPCGDPGLRRRGLQHAQAELEAQRDENTCRKDFTPTEAAAMREAIAAVLRPLAPKGGRVKDRETSRIAAKGTGYSPAPSTKVDKVTEIAGDEAQPEGTIAWRVYRCANTKMPSELQV
jgi:hypothetical protein